MCEVFRRAVVSNCFQSSLEVINLAVERWCSLITVMMMLVSDVNSEIPGTICQGRASCEYKLLLDL